MAGMARLARHGMVRQTRWDAVPVGDDDQSNAEKMTEAASEKIVLPRGELWLLRIAAATGAISMLAHGIEFLHQVGLW